jgi:SAM-dependent methyltransferase
MTNSATIVRHYENGDLNERLRAALDAGPLAGSALAPGDLAPIDQFHMRGLAATVDLADAAGIDGGTAVLDIGSGIGGPSRYLAATFGCQVTGIDLTPAFVAAATLLASRTGLAGKVRYECGDALSLPYGDGSFDLVWTQHVAMNIADRARHYREAHRVLRKGGRLATYDIVAGTPELAYFPLPWARDPDTSFLLSAAATRSALEAAGFRVAAWVDQTSAGIAWLDEMQQRQSQPAAPAQPPGLTLTMGPEFPTMIANLGRNMRERRAGLLQAVLERA